MQSRFWRTGHTYALLAAIPMIMVGPALSWHYGKITHPINLLFAGGLVLSVVWLVEIRIRTTYFTAADLRRMVTEILGHQARYPLIRACPLNELRDGEAGWTSLSLLLDFIHGKGNEFLPEREYLATKDVELQARPEGRSPVLVFRDERGGLHMFRFGREPKTWSGPDPGRGTRLIRDHGLAGPARFEFGLIA